MYTLERFGTLLVPEYNPIHRSRGGGRVPSMMDLASGGAFDPYGSQQIRPGARDFSVRCVILGSHAERHAVIDAWLARAGARDRLWARSQSNATTNTVQWVWARLHPLQLERSYQRPNYDELTLEWTGLSTYWHGLKHGNGLDMDTGEALDDGLVLDYAGSVYDTLFPLASDSQSVTLVNNGNAPVVDPVITVHAGTNAIANTVLTLNGAVLGYSGTIAAGKNLVIDVGGQSVKNDGVDAYSSAFTLPTTQMDWLLIQPGSNSISVATTGGGTGKYIAFDYHDSWHG